MQGSNVIKIISFVIFLCTVAVCNPTQAYASENANHQQEQMLDQQQFLNAKYWAYSFSQDNFFRRLFGRRKGTTAQEQTRSRRHPSSRPKRYSPPESRSQNAGDIGDRSTTSHPSSDMSTVRNTPRPPLHTSLRDQHHALGIWELGLSLGTSHAITDLGENKNMSVGDFTDYHSSNFGLNIGFYARYIMNEWFALRMGMDFASLSAENEGVTLPAQPRRFTNDVFEFYARTEFMVPQLSRSPLDVYGFVGFGVFFSDARVYDMEDRLITTQDDYSQVQPVIPFGLGFSVNVANNIKVGYEFGWRNTIFHYLDGVKIDNSNNYDHYFLNSLKIGFTF